MPSEVSVLRVAAHAHRATSEPIWFKGMAAPRHAAWCSARNRITMERWSHRETSGHAGGCRRLKIAHGERKSDRRVRPEETRTYAPRGPPCGRFSSGGAERLNTEAQ